MIGACVVMMATVVSGAEVAKPDMKAALKAFDRLAVLTEKPLNETPEAKKEHGPSKAEYEDLRIYLGLVTTVIETGRYDDAYFQNTLTVITQLVAAGKMFAATPEEALCWERAGLNLTATFRQVIAQRVKDGKSPATNVDQVNAAYERARRSYQQALAKCLTSLD